MKIVLVYNPRSGSALTAKELRAKCKAAGIEIERLISMSDDFEKKLALFLNKRTIIAVIGGDGTVSSVAGIVVGTKAVLAPLPGGTLNHFTKDLGIPQDIDEALSRLVTAKQRLIDVATVNGQVFVNNSSLGLYSSSLLMRENLENKLGKWIAAIVASVGAIFRFQVFQVRVNGETFRTPFIFIGNNDYKLDEVGGAQRMRLDEGILGVCIAKTRARSALIKIALWAVVGKAKVLDEFDVYTTKKLIIETKRRHLHVSRDGEVSKMSLPLHYAIQKKVLNIL